MTKCFFIYITSLQDVNGQTETSQVNLPCSYERKNGITRISYNENLDGQNVTFVVVLDKNRVIIDKCGIHSSKLIFEKNCRHTCTYGTEFGNIEMNTFAHQVTYDADESHCNIELHYSLESNNNILNNNRVIINVREINNVEDSIKNN